MLTHRGISTSGYQEASFSRSIGMVSAPTTAKSLCSLQSFSSIHSLSYLSDADQRCLAADMLAAADTQRELLRGDDLKKGPHSDDWELQFTLRGLAEELRREMDEHG
eukprot:TRINITY_DN95231_c0_g1_i2.p1 TRINITY_DN95231_c0_g1~~TRINITY_DN95231_c0_g1_i2.p1  ORF type:complete len:107 (-),score=15.30 TRINITY_DN95231_c0_g1_i2:83-403(-)